MGSMQGTSRSITAILKTRSGNELIAPRVWTTAHPFNCLKPSQRTEILPLHKNAPIIYYPMACTSRSGFEPMFSPSVSKATIEKSTKLGLRRELGGTSLVHRRLGRCCDGICGSWKLEYNYIALTLYDGELLWRVEATTLLHFWPKLCAVKSNGYWSLGIQF